MSIRFPLTSIAALVLCTTAACNERSGGVAPIVPPPPSGTIGMITGTVVGDKMTATFTPMGAQAAAYGLSPTIYGDPTKAHITGQLVSMLPAVYSVGQSRTWIFNVSMHNLMANSQGSSWGGAAPQDSSGVFLGFTQLPSVSLPVPCVGCGVGLVGAMGTANFTAPNQPYFWYPNRVQPAGSPGGKDSTPAVQWTFTTNTYTGCPCPPGADSVHAFFFQLYVNAFWPAPASATWSVVYNGTTDSLPQSAAEPRWKQFVSNGSNTLGVETWSSAGLVMSATSNTRSVYLGRHDSLGTNSAYMDATLKVANVNPGTPQAAFGFAEPGTGRQMFAVIASDRVGIGNFAEGNGNWTFQGIITFALTATNFHTYRLRKIGTTSVQLCVDGTLRVTRTYAQQQQTRLSFATSSTTFGIDGRAVNASSTWSALSWTIGSDGGGCT